MAIISDFECTKCKTIHEELVHRDQRKSTCPECGKTSKKIITGKNVLSESPTWMKSVLEVVDKTNPAAHVQEFVKNPTRDNYKAWMKGEKIRPADHTVHGGPPVYERPPQMSIQEKARILYEAHRARKSVSLS